MPGTGRYIIERKNMVTGEWRGIRYCGSRSETDTRTREYMAENPQWHLRAIEVKQNHENTKRSLPV